jgi:hypothetical protein
MPDLDTEPTRALEESVFTLGDLPPDIPEEQEAWRSGGQVASEIPPSLDGLWDASPYLPQALDVSSLRVGRILWTVAMVLRFPGRAETFDAKCMNLSLSGMGFFGPAGLQKGDLVEIHCPLGIEEPSSYVLTGEIVWSRMGVGKAWYYGMQFKSLPSQSQNALQNFMHTVQKSDLGLEKPARLRKRVFGYGGWLLGAVMMALCGAGGFYASQSGRFWALFSQAILDKQGDKVANRQPLAGYEYLKTGGLNTQQSSQSVVLDIPLETEPQDYQTFWLQHPLRLVVDLPQQHTLLTGSHFEIAHSLLQRVRIGRYPEKTRFVFELKQEQIPNVSFYRHESLLKIKISALAGDIEW